MSEKLPRVTGVLKDTGFIDTRWFNEFYANRGSMVHKACQFHDEGTLDRDSLDEHQRGCLAAYEKFLSDTGMIFSEIEQTRIHEVLRYVGTPDRVGWCQAWGKTIVDIKGGVPMKWHRYQLGAYAMLVDPISPENCSRVSVYLSPKGKYKMSRFEDNNDTAVFAAALTVYRALRGN